MRDDVAGRQVGLPAARRQHATISASLKARRRLSRLLQGACAPRRAARAGRVSCLARASSPSPAERAVPAAGACAHAPAPASSRAPPPARAPLLARRRWRRSSTRPRPSTCTCACWAARCVRQRSPHQRMQHARRCQRASRRANARPLRRTRLTHARARAAAARLAPRPALPPSSVRHRSARQPPCLRSRARRVPRVTPPLERVPDAAPRCRAQARWCAAHCAPSSRACKP
jgi:hypothetical protein